jgi:hypothetical protein
MPAGAGDAAKRGHRVAVVRTGRGCSVCVLIEKGFAGNLNKFVVTAL